VLVGGINGSVELTTTSTIPGIPTFSEEDSSTNFGLVFGGGVNFGVSGKHWDPVRCGLPADLREDEGDGSNVFRFQLGLCSRVDQFPTTNAQLPTTTKAQRPKLPGRLRWELGVGRGWELGRWALGIEASQEQQ
jgi:hypothetical protein